MSLAYRIARRIHFAPEGVSTDGGSARRVSRPAVRIAITGVAIGIIVMLLTVGVVVGFKEEVRNKATGFGGHLTIQALDPGRTFETVPICLDDTLFQLVTALPEVQSARAEVTKPAVMRTDSDFMSVVVKGIGPSVSSGQSNQSASSDPSASSSQGVVISRTIADRMLLHVGDRIKLLFIQQSLSADPFALGAAQQDIRVRTLFIDSIYQTHLSEIDSRMILVPMSLLQQVSGWDDDMVSGLEVQLRDFGQLEDTYYAMLESLSPWKDRRGTPAYVRTIEEASPALFSWLALLDTNVWVILILIAVVAAFTTISGLMIIILERAQMIGILKALGMDNGTLRHVFLWVALMVVGKGLLWGNVIGLMLCFVQWQWHPIALDPQNYYLEWVPIHLDLWHIIAINVGCIAITLLVLLGPSALVARISPARTLSDE